MKFKLKDGVDKADMPRFSSMLKGIVSHLNTNDSIELDEMPKQLKDFLEEVPSAKAKVVTPKGGE
jgi:alanine racemase